MGKSLLKILIVCGLSLLHAPLQSAECLQPQAQPVATGESRPEQGAGAKPETSENHGAASRMRLGTASVTTLPISGIGNTAGLRPVSKDATQPSIKTRKRVEFVGAPIPVIDPAIGNGLAVVGAVTVYLNANDLKSPPSVFGGGLLHTSNGTSAYGALTELFLKEDRFRITGLFAKGNINYDYYLSGPISENLHLFIPLALNGLVFLIEPKVRLVGRWYAGPRYVLLKSEVGLDLAGWTHDPDLPTIDLFPVRAAALGLRVQHDSRDNQFYARKGSLFDVKSDFFRSGFGSLHRNYDHIEVSYQGYRGFGQKNVFAYRAAACSASTGTPFYGLCMLGDIRGYATGRYQDHRMLAGQVEYRRELFWRLGATGFFGAGEVAEQFSKFNASNILPGGGLGLRFLLAEQSHINFRVDYAWGRGSTALYISVGEAF